MLITATLPTVACGPYYPENPASIRVFRSCTPDLERQWQEGCRFQDYEKYENCLLWQKITSTDIPLKDIEHVVYDARINDILNFPQGKLAGNKFSEWLTKPTHREDLEYLLTAKKIEEIREYMNDPWYYAYEGDEEHMHLDSLLNQCEEYRGTRHSSRYALQLARLYFAKKDFGACRNLWESKVSSMPQNIVTDMIASYAGGAFARGGNRDKAIELFERCQDIGSLINLKAWDDTLSTSRYTDRRVRELEYIFSRFPNSPLLSVKLQEYVRNRERFVFNYADWEARGFHDPVYFDTKWVGDSLVAVTDNNFYDELKRFANKAIASTDCDQKGMWNYALAYLYFLDNNFSKSASYLAQAERSEATPFIKESIRAFRFLFDAHYANNTIEYKNKLLRELKWLDECMARDAKLDAANNWQYDNKMNYPFYFWQDVARRVLLCEACPRIDNAGNPVLALQLANYASNRILQLSPIYGAYHYGYDDQEYRESYTNYISISEFRINWSDRNPFDYSSQFFDLINSSSADVAAYYALHITSPTSELERFLNERGYVDNDYICDIVGTLYLREMNYSKASEWLSKVSQGYQQRTNIAKDGYFKLDPFCYQVDKKHFIADSNDYKLHFAQEMLRLENMIQSDAESNRKADAKILFAIGLRNSFGRCWYLTDYEYLLGDNECENWQDWKMYPSSCREGFIRNTYAQRAYRRVDKLMSEALSEYTDPELAAKAQFDMMNLKAIMDKYPLTKIAAYIRSRCDNYRDYSLQKR
ncbi:hypothetical protein EEL50_09185 [Muribaculaceae bacterium Isolate-105 (HZI)]|nr:hypothetical protein EEL50_09185 [Muribaculaceae bacterium Isolate-105 (HZI)]